MGILNSMNLTQSEPILFDEVEMKSQMNELNSAILELESLFWLGFFLTETDATQTLGMNAEFVKPYP